MMAIFAMHQGATSTSLFMASISTALYLKRKESQVCQLMVLFI